MSKNILYISYDGMTDPLGQSQVIPYLAGLSKCGYQITLISAEKPEVYQKHQKKIQKLLVDSNINWQPIFYTKKPPIISTLKDVRAIINKAKLLHKESPFSIIHCRSYISAFVGIYFKRKFGCKFLFDMRGFWPDERVDGNIWNIKNPIYNVVYKYFKRKEKQFFIESDAIISLTHAGKEAILKWNLKHVTNEKINIIPCCADFNHFDFKKIELEHKKAWQEKLKIPEDYFVFSYLGSIGTWYMMDEMLLMFSILKRKQPKSLFLFITKDNPEIVFDRLSQFNLDKSDIRITSAERNEVPELLSLVHASVFFYKPTWSKKATSPTKMAELMGLGVPVIANKKIGDVESILKDNPTGIVVEDLTTESLEKGIDQLLSFTDQNKSRVRDLACEYFSLDKGISTFEQIYKKLSE